MSRRPNPQRKALLLAEIVEYVRKNGIADLTLRPLAAALETSPRNLLYHFHSSNELITVTLNELAREDREAFDLEFGQAQGDTPAQLVDRFVHFFNQRTASIRVYLELSLLHLTTGEDLAIFMHECTKPWYDHCEKVLSSAGYNKQRAKALSSLVVGTLWGSIVTRSTDPKSDGKRRSRDMIDALKDLLVSAQVD